MGIGLCSTKGEAPQTVFNIKDKYILVETLSERILPGGLGFFPVICSLEREGVSFFLISLFKHRV